MPGLWEPTALEMLLAMNAVLNDPLVASDALFIHGAPARDDELDYKLLAMAKVAWNGRAARKIVVNGLTADTCRERNLAYVGHEEWVQRLVNMEVREEDIILLPVSPHTGAESRNLITLARERGWGRITIMSYPHHQLRCFLQIVALMAEMGVNLNVHNLTHHELGWNRELKKPVMAGQTVLGGTDVDGTFPRHIEEEFIRIVAYAQPPTAERPYTRHATIPEMLAYLDQRG